MPDDPQDPFEDDLVDAFLRELSAEGGLDPLLSALGSGAVDPPEALRRRLLGALSLEGRFDRFVATVARLMDVDEAASRALLDGIGRPASWEGSEIEGVALYHLEGGPRVAGAVTGFVRMEGGAVFPEHEHLGEEQVLVVQGSFRDGVSGQVFHAGDVATMASGTRHDFQARPGPDLVYLVVVQNGVRIGDVVFGPDDPNM